MNESSGKLTIFFEDPFWVGMIEETEHLSYRAAKIVFGTEPTDAQVYEYLMTNYGTWRFSNAMLVQQKQTKCQNPKRLRRRAVKESDKPFAGTKAQQAVKLQQEANAALRKSLHRQRREEQAQMQYELRQEKKKQKHRGR